MEGACLYIDLHLCLCIDIGELKKQQSSTLIQERKGGQKSGATRELRRIIMAFNRGFLFSLFVAAHLVANASAATYVVGDGLGWNVPPNAATYATWASQHVFRAGDVLVFNFTTGFHDVAHVSRASFDGCSSSNPIELATVGPANLILNSTGTNYYICTFGSHCSLGQKLAVNVTSNILSPPPSVSPPSPTPIPAPIPTPIPAPIPTPTPTPTPAPTPMPSVPSPSISPTPSPMAPSPGPKSPSPTPSGSVSPPAPSSVTAPGSGPTAPGDLSPPPPPNSASIAGISAKLVIFASLAFGLVV